MKIVTKDEFFAFIESYPNKLETNVTFIGEPPCRTYNDYERGPWPQSIIGSIILGETKETRRYSIDEEPEES